MAKFPAWCVHCYTALGLVAAAGMAVFIVRGDEDSLHKVIALMIAATFIDMTDGWLARRAKVKELIPQFDGRRLDDIIDFQTYTSLPLLFIWRAGVLPDSLAWYLLIPLIASAYGFSQADAKTEDNFFLGFPSYWNVVAIYLFWLRPPVWFSLSSIVVLALLTFVPSLYLYTSRGGRFSLLTNILCVIWVVTLIIIVGGVIENPTPLIWASLVFPIYYFVFSWIVTLRRWFRKDGQELQQRHRLSTLATETPQTEE